MVTIVGLAYRTLEPVTPTEILIQLEHRGLVSMQGIIGSKHTINVDIKHKPKLHFYNYTTQDNHIN